MDKDKLALLHALTHIAANGPKHEGIGICGNVDEIMGGKPYTVLRVLLSSWPERGDDWLFPVEGAAAYAMSRNKWDLSTEYGQKRYRLLAFMIHELSKEYHANQRAA